MTAINPNGYSTNDAVLAQFLVMHRHRCAAHIDPTSNRACFTFPDSIALRDDIVTYLNAESMVNIHAFGRAGGILRSQIRTAHNRHLTAIGQ